MQNPETRQFMSDRNVIKWFGPSLHVTLHDSLLTRLSLTSIGWQRRVEPVADGTDCRGGGWSVCVGVSRIAAAGRLSLIIQLWNMSWIRITSILIFWGQVTPGASLWVKPEQTLQGHWDFWCRFWWLCASLQLNYAESRLTQLEGCHCERTCSANGLVYRDKELWVEPENCRNCACKVSVISITSKEAAINKYINMDMTLPPLVLECLCREPKCTDANVSINSDSICGCQQTLCTWPSNIRELQQF